jgi:DNA-binding transcriptional MerR regulator
MTHTVKQLARLAGVSVRTLHHYDDIGLLIPPTIGANGYRYYDERSVLRLQAILFYRELGFSLDKIKELLGRREVDAIQTLSEQRLILEDRVEQFRRMIATLDQTIRHLKGETTMKTKDLFQSLTPEREDTHSAEAARRWDPATVRASQKRWSRYHPQRKKQIIDEGNAVYRDLAAAMPLGASSPPVQAAIERWRAHIGCFWTPNDEQCVGLSQLYRDDAAFRANYDAIHPELANFMVEAVKVHVSRKKSDAASRTGQP